MNETSCKLHYRNVMKNSGIVMAIMVVVNYASSVSAILATTRWNQSDSEGNLKRRCLGMKL